MGSGGSRQQRGTREETEAELLKQVPPKYYNPKPVRKELFLHAIPSVVDESLQFMVEDVNIFKPIIEMLEVGVKNREKHAAISTIDFEVLQNNTGCDLMVELGSVFDRQASDWVNGQIYFTEADHSGSTSSSSFVERRKNKENYDAIKRSLDTHQAPASETVTFESAKEEDAELDPSLTETEEQEAASAVEQSDEETDVQSARQRFNDRVYDGIWNEKMDPNNSIEQTLRFSVPANSKGGKVESLYGDGLDFSCLLVTFGMTEGTLAQVRWDPTGDTVSYEETQHMGNWFTMPDNRKALNMSDSQVVVKNGRVHVPKSFYFKANIGMAEKVLSKIHYTQFRQSELSFVIKYPEQEKKFIEKLRTLYEKCGNDPSKHAQVVLHHSVSIKIIVNMVIGSKIAGTRCIEFEDGFMWV